MIRLGIVGTGNMAQYQASQFVKMRGVKVVACCDVIKEAAEVFAGKWNISRVYDDYRVMLKNEPLDAVTVITPDYTHAAICGAAARRGLAILCEKPMGVTLNEASAMVRAVKKYGVVNMVNLSKADAGGLIGAHKHIQSGKIGKILHVEARFHQGWLAGPKSATTPMRISGAWRLSSKKGLGALGDLGTHLFSVADTLCGSINEISCRVRTFDKLGGVHAKADANDSFVASVSFADGALGAIRATRWASGCGWGDIFITAFGEHGSVEVNLAEMFHGFKHFSCKTNAWKTEKLKPAPSTFVRFIRSVRSGKNDPLSFEYGRKIQAYLHHCLMSDRQNRPVKVPS